MARRSRRARERVLLPGETLGRRRFLQYGAVGVALLAGAGWLAWRPGERAAGVGGPLAVLSPEEAAVLQAISRRVLPRDAPFPSPERVRVAERVDALLAMSHRGVQRDVKRLLTLFDSALLGLALDLSPVRFRSASPERQDARLAAWSTSRVALRRTGFRALRRLVASAYWSSPATWEAVGYPGPPSLGPPAPAARPEGRPRLRGPGSGPANPDAGSGPAAAGAAGGERG